MADPVMGGGVWGHGGQVKIQRAEAVIASLFPHPRVIAYMQYLSRIMLMHESHCNLDAIIASCSFPCIIINTPFFNKMEIYTILVFWL